MNKEILTFIFYEIENCKKNIEIILMKTDFSEFEKLSILEHSFQKELNEIQMKLRNFNAFEVSLNNILNNEILLTDNALQKIKIKDVLEQINDLEEGNSQSLKNIPNIYYDIIEDISTNEEVKLYLNETNMNIPKIREGIQKLFEALINNTAITAAPKDEYQRRLEYHKLLKGFKVIAEILKESSIEPILKLGNIIMISEVSYYCASGWKDTLLELMTKFSLEIKEKYRNSINLDYEKDPLKRILNEIFFNARECITKDLSYRYIDDKNISIAERPHYIDVFKQVFNEVYNLNLPFIETTDSYLGSDHINTIKENFIDSLRNVYINDLIYDKACELFYDRLREEPEFYIGSKIMPKFWGDIMEWSKKYFHSHHLDHKFSSVIEFMSEYIIGNDASRHPIRYIAIKEIMKDCGFIEEIIKDNKYGNDYYRKQSEITMTRLKRGIMDIKSGKELNQLNNNLISIHSRGVDIKTLIDFIVDNNNFELMNHINFDSFDIDINEADVNGVTKLMKVCQTCNDCNSIKYIVKAKENINQQDKYGWTALMYALYNKNVEMARFLIENGADVNLSNNVRWTALMYSCRRSEDLELIKRLIDVGSNINHMEKKGWTALMLAIEYNKNLEIAKFLIERGADVHLIDHEKWNALIHACRCSEDVELIQLLIDAGSNINQQTKDGLSALMIAIEYNETIEIAKFLISHGADVNLLNDHKWTALMFACRYSEDFELIKQLIDAGSNINQQNKDGWTALMLAIEYNGNPNVSKLLIERGADITIVNNCNWTALKFACYYTEDIELIKLLIKAGSNIDQQSKLGWTALMSAVRYNRNTKISKFLIESGGAEVNLGDGEEENLTPLMVACRYSTDFELVKLLIEAGSHLNQQNRDDDGFTPLMYAVRYNKNRNIIKLLIENGAEVNMLSHHRWSALMIASRYSEDLELIRLLIKSGSNIREQNEDKHTAFMIAKKYNHNYKISKYLMKKEAAAVGLSSSSSPSSPSYRSPSSSSSSKNYKSPIISIVHKILR
ncbi:ankyrin [Neocallimastix sp. 'constans']